MVPRLRLGQFRGAPHADISHNVFPQTSKLRYFGIRYYPQYHVPNRTSEASPIEQDDGRRGTDSPEPKTVHLDRKLIFSLVMPISKTSKSAVIRRRMGHRLTGAFRAELLSSPLPLIDPTSLPGSMPMHVVLSPNRSLFLAPFDRLRRDVRETFSEVRAKFERLPERRRLAAMVRPPVAPRIHKRPEMRRPPAARDVEGHVRRLLQRMPASSYLAQQGGASALLKRLRDQQQQQQQQQGESRGPETVENLIGKQSVTG